MTTLLERVYFALAFIGLVLTWYFNLHFFAEGGSIAPESFFPSAFANSLTTAITLDVYWAALVFSVWVIARRHEPFAPKAGIYVILCFTVGLAFAFPLYLGRARQLTRLAARETSSSGSDSTRLPGTA